MGVIVQHPAGGAAAIGMIIASTIAALAHPAAAQRTDVEAAAAFNVGYNQTTRTVFVPDPNAQAADRPDSTTSQAFVEIRPGIALQSGTPRWTWRGGYVFGGSLSLSGDSVTSYSNQLEASLAAQATPFTTVTLAASGAQGGTGFVNSQRAADMGQPEIRAPGSSNRVAGSLAEGISIDLAKHLTLQQTLVGSVNAPQDDLEERNSALAGSLALERGFVRDSLGLELHGNVSWLRPLQADQGPYQSYTSALLARWNHDFTTSWNGSVSAGVEQVYTDTASRPLAFLPSGALAVRYTYDQIGGGIDVSHGTATNLQVGAISLTDRVTLHGNIVLDPREARGLAFSAGFLHNEPLGETSPLVAAGTGNAVQADAGFMTQLARNVLATARYSLAYQFGQGGGLPSTLAHIFYVGITATYRNTEEPKRPLPVRGQRVDGGDARGFEVVDEPVEDDRSR